MWSALLKLLVCEHPKYWMGTAHAGLVAGDDSDTLNPEPRSKDLCESERMCLDVETGAAAHRFRPARPSFPRAEGAPRCDIMPVATDTTGAQFRAGKYIVKIRSLGFRIDLVCCASHRRATEKGVAGV